VPHDADELCVVVLSPHLDDAVLSAWDVLSSPGEVRVVTVFAGIPEPGFVTDLDRAHGAGESAAWMRRRRCDDRAALALAGRTPVHMDLPDVQFAAYRQPGVHEAIARSPDQYLARVAAEPGLGTDPAVLAGLLAECVPAHAVVYGPAGIGGHPDHRDLARATVLLAGTGRDVRLYADSPYYIARGLPSWLGGKPNPAADQLADGALVTLGLPPQGLDRHTAELAEGRLQRKVAAMRCYATEIPAIWTDLSRSPSTPAMMRYESYWTVPGPPR
jgi:LmbE family N-acetylglucosaminyl deacetylase